MRKLKLRRGKSKAELEREVKYLRNEIMNGDRANREAFKAAQRELLSTRARGERGTDDDRRAMSHYYRGWDACFDFLMPRITGETDGDEL